MERTIAADAVSHKRLMYVYIKKLNKITKLIK